MTTLDKAHIYRMVVSVLDTEGVSPMADVIEEVERSRYFSIRAHKAEMINEVWADDHPLNRKMTYEEYEAWWEAARDRAVGR